MTDPLTESKAALEQARLAYNRGDFKETRRWAERAATLAPDREEPWLWLATVAGPRASVEYVNRALQINPQSARVRKAMDWAVRRYRAVTPTSAPRRPIVDPNIPTAAVIRPRPSLARRMLVPLAAAIVILLVTIAVLAAPYPPLKQAAAQVLSQVEALASGRPAAAIDISLVKATRTATFTPTLTPTPTATFTPTPTYTPTPTFTPIPTDTPVPTDTPPPTETEGPPPPDVPNGISQDEHWIDIDLTNQMAFAYEGDVLINSFLVSTGTWQHPTVTGTYQIYVMYRYADMSGPGYYLPDVPYVMYFHDGYGLHGTYWHDNFGTPMSHGCVNLATPDAEWVFGFVEVGTVVNVHY